MTERELREHMAVLGRSLFDRGLTAGSSGNLSVKLPDGMLVTPTNSCLGRLDPDRITKLSHSGNVVSGDHPSKEAFLHDSMYRSRPDEQAIVHLHSHYSVAVSCLAEVNQADVLPPLTAYYVMRVGRLPLVPFFPPGDEALAAAVEESSRHSRSLLLSHHGPVVAGKSLDAAVNAIEELEATARLFLTLAGQDYRSLNETQVAELRQRFPA